MLDSHNSKKSLKSSHVWQSYARNNKKDGYRQQNVYQRQKLIIVL